MWDFLFVQCFSLKIMFVREHSFFHEWFVEKIPLMSCRCWTTSVAPSHTENSLELGLPKTRKSLESIQLVPEKKRYLYFGKFPEDGRFENVEWLARSASSVVFPKMRSKGCLLSLERRMHLWMMLFSCRNYL